MDTMELESEKLFDENFSINSDEASSILGVSKTRLSQLTQKGQFSYERRKVGMRSRIFYKLSDLLSYQRHQTFFHASQDSREQTYKPGASRVLEGNLNIKEADSFESHLNDNVRSSMEKLLSHSFTAFQDNLSSVKNAVLQNHAPRTSAKDLKKEENFEENIQVIINKLDALFFEFKEIKSEFSKHFDILRNLSFHLSHLGKRENENSSVLSQCKQDLNFIKGQFLKEKVAHHRKRKKIFFSKKKRR